MWTCTWIWVKLVFIFRLEMFHSSSGGTAGYNDGSFHQHHLQQSPVYVPGNRSISQYPSSAGGHFGASAHQSSWAHAGGTYGEMAGPSAHSLGASPHHATTLSAGQFYAQNMMMGSWRAYDGTGFQRTSPYGKFVWIFKKLITLIVFGIIFKLHLRKPSVYSVISTWEKLLML